MSPSLFPVKEEMAEMEGGGGEISSFLRKQPSTLMEHHEVRHEGRRMGLSFPLAAAALSGPR